jgi:hypothetical protein
VISFNPAYLAGALEIGSTLRLVDRLNPGMTTDPSGNFCVIMNLRTRAETVSRAATQPAPVATAA